MLQRRGILFSWENGFTTPHFWGLRGRSFLGCASEGQNPQVESMLLQLLSPSLAVCRDLWLLEAPNLYLPTPCFQAGLSLHNSFQTEPPHTHTHTQGPPKKTCFKQLFFASQQSPHPRPQGQHFSCHHRQGRPCHATTQPRRRAGQ